MGDISELIEDGRDFWDEYEEAVYEINKRWASGRHMLKDGKCIKIKDMETPHIQNCINLWSKNKDYDLTPFRKELKKRQ
jgi:Fe2+ or Zn2+ uptake regulation protein